MTKPGLPNALGCRRFLNPAKGFGVQIPSRGISPEAEPGYLVAAEQRFPLHNDLVREEGRGLIQNNHRMVCVYEPLRVVAPALRHLEPEVVIISPARTRSSSAQEVRAVSVCATLGASCPRELPSGMRLAVIVLESCSRILCRLWRGASAPGGGR